MIEKEREGEREREVRRLDVALVLLLLLLLLLQNLGERKRNETKSIKQNRKQQNRTISEWNPFLVQFFPRYPRERFNRGDYRRRRGRARRSFVRSSPRFTNTFTKFTIRSSTTAICATALSLCVCPVATHSTSWRSIRLPLPLRVALSALLSYEEEKRERTWMRSRSCRDGDARLIFFLTNVCEVFTRNDETV